MQYIASSACDTLEMEGLCVMKLKEIAKIANVSPSTVTLVLNNREGVSPEKRRQIQDLLDKYGYSSGEQSTAKRPAPALRQTRLLFVKYKEHSMLVDGNPGFVNSIIDAVEMECRRQNCSLSLMVASRDQLPSLSSMINNEAPDGVLLLGTELKEDDCLSFASVKAPMVIIDNFPKIHEFNCITMNNFSAIYGAVKHLLELGHPNVGFLANAVPSSNCLERLAAFESSLMQLGRKFDPDLVYAVQPTTDGAYVSVSEYLRRGTKFPSAIVANNDSIALGAIKAFKEHGIRIPQDISIIGFDNIPFSNMSDPPLTTMDVSCVELGIWAVRLLCDHIRYPMSSTTKVRLSARLLTRGSTAQYAGK